MESLVFINGETDNVEIPYQGAQGLVMAIDEAKAIKNDHPFKFVEVRISEKGVEGHLIVHRTDDK